ncbi:hypothetical protein M426DRAFT_23045 [Hypoxylon sp. CI-4A]|nr:hypothetical protein M426DRAFT_23045 [Hypoxylon sp. CI-4A]
MESRVYSIDELLRLRRSLSHNILPRLQANQDVLGLMKDNRTSNTMASSRNKGLAAHEDISSSTDGEEILFQGKKPGKKANKNGWAYLGRAESELSMTEPLPAPAGLPAQQSEGFQRFFKAVVSPTHVRVTAGGRIVPNPRGSVSPTAKWDKERPALGQHDSIESKETQPEIANGIGGHLPHPLLQPPFPGHPFPGQFFAGHPIPGHPIPGQPFPGHPFPGQPMPGHPGLMPMPLYPFGGFPMQYGMPIHHHPSLGANQLKPTPSREVLNQSQQETEEAVKAVKTQDGAADKKPRPAPLKIVPREQSEQSEQARPFHPGGGMIYPTPYGPSPMMMPIQQPYFPHGMSPVIAGHPGVPMGSNGQPSPAGSVFGVAGTPSANIPNSGGAQQFPTVPAPNQGIPHKTSIKPSVITRRQLETLRMSLKHYEDQLKFNRHQVDENFTLTQVGKIKENISNFEQIYEEQLKVEAEPHSQLGSATSAAQESSWKTASGLSSEESHRGGDASQNGSIGANRHSRAITSRLSSEGAGPKSALERYAQKGLNSSEGSNSTLGTDSTLDQVLRRKPKMELGTSEPTKHARLPTDASLEPVADVGAHSSASRAGALQHGVQGSGALTAGYGFSYPYLTGMLPHGADLHHAQRTDYIYSRELTTEEKQARDNYWGRSKVVSSGLPKFDGRDFYPPSPIKTMASSGFQRAIPGTRAEVNYNTSGTGLLPPARQVQGKRSQEGIQRVSKAIPIVAPHDGNRGKDFMNGKVSSKSEASADASVDKKSAANRGTVRGNASPKSGDDLWQTLLKRGAANRGVLPGAVSSTTATGLLPQYNGHAAASLGPTVSNTSNPTRAPAEGRDKAVDHEVSPLPTKKVGENRPPKESRSEDNDPFKDVQRLMLRDAERRGVISSER